MRYVIIGLSMFGAWALCVRFFPTGIMGLSVPVLLIGAAVLAVVVSHRVK